MNLNNNMENKVIVFGCNHQNMLGLVRSLGEKGIRPYCICLKSSNGLVFRSKYPALCYHVDSPQEGYQYIIDNFSNEPIKPILLSSDDVTETLFDKNATVLREHFIVPAADEDGKVTFLMNKKNIGELAHKYGFQTPKMWVVSSEEDITDEISYPVFTKSLKSIDGGKKEERKCNDKTELLEVLRDCCSGALLVQQFIDKIDEIDYIGFSAKGKIFIPYIQHQMRFSDRAYGGYHKFEKNVKNVLLDNVINLLQEIRFEGLFSVEFLIDKSGNWYFTEVNFRHDGHTYLITPGGANIPYLYCRMMVDGVFDLDESTIKPTIIGMNEIVDLGQFVKTKKVSVAKWLWQWITADSHIMWNWKDNGPLWFMVKQALFKKSE